MFFPKPKLSNFHFLLFLTVDSLLFSFSSGHQTSQSLKLENWITLPLPTEPMPTTLRGCSWMYSSPGTRLHIARWTPTRKRGSREPVAWFFVHLYITPSWKSTQWQDRPSACPSSWRQKHLLCMVCLAKQSCGTMRTPKSSSPRQFVMNWTHTMPCQRRWS